MSYILDERSERAIWRFKYTGGSKKSLTVMKEETEEYSENEGWKKTNKREGVNRERKLKGKKNTHCLPIINVFRVKYEV